MTAEIIPERIQIESSGRRLEGLVYTPLRPSGKQVLIVQCCISIRISADSCVTVEFR